MLDALAVRASALWLGHHSPAFTLATYVHLLADDLPEVAFLDELADRWRYAGATDVSNSDRNNADATAAESGS
jgi:hypothetical protein